MNEEEKKGRRVAEKWLEEDYPYWGEPIREGRGRSFWWAIRSIFEWLPLLPNRLVEKLSRMLEAI